jgi:hypothetical protein
VLVACGLIGVAALVLGLSTLHADTRVVRRGDLEGVIFGRRAAAATMRSALAQDATDYWTPNRGQILAMEERLRVHVWLEHPVLARSLSTYKRQYFGFAREGQRRILIVGFCEADDLNWTQDFVSAAESRDCRFEAEYDVPTGQILHFWTLDESR